MARTGKIAQTCLNNDVLRILVARLPTRGYKTFVAEDALILTAHMMPHRVVNWQTAVCLVLGARAEVLESYDATVSSPSRTLALPAVLRLVRSEMPFKRVVKFNRLNVFARDEFRCQYCGQHKGPKELTYDHVVPRVAGGQTVWTNIVTSCYACNNRKAGRRPHEAGMTLLKQPVRPAFLPRVHPVVGFRQIPSCWAPYLQDGTYW